MEEKQINKLVQALDLGKVVSEPTPVTGGLLHQMYGVVTSKGKFAVKVLNREIMKRPTALCNTINSEKVAAAFCGNIPVVAALNIQGKQIHELDEDYFMVFPWLEGKSVFPPDIGEWHCEAIGDILGKIHSLNIVVEGVLPERGADCLYDWEKYLRLAKEQGLQDRAWLSQYEKAIKDIIVWNQAMCKAQKVLAQKVVISHRDLDPKNVMWQEEKPFLIDWEAAGYVNPYQELLEVINYWADDGKGGLNPCYFRAIMNAYQRHMDLTDVAWDAVFAGSYAGMLGWLEYNVKRALGIEVSDEEERKPGEEQAIGTVKELYSYQKKLEIIRNM